MPFHPPFNESYHAGDLIYGLENPRKRLISDYFNLNMRNIRTVDLAVINNYLTTDDEQSTQESRLQHSGFNNSQEKQYREQVAQFNDYLKKHPKYQTAVGWKAGALKGAQRDIAENSAWRRKCKGGLLYTCFHTQNHIHFCLEGLDFGTVANKNYKRDDFVETKHSDTDKLRAVTNAELRWIYRNRLHKEVQDHVQFWHRDPASQQWRSCTPPWESVTGQTAWNNYQPKSLMVRGTP